MFRRSRYAHTKSTILVYSLLTVAFGKPSHLVDLTELAFDDAFKAGRIPMMAVAPSPGGCDEFCRLMYLEKKATKQELEDMKGRLSGLREHGEFITLSVVPMDQVWRVSADAKAMM